MKRFLKNLYDLNQYLVYKIFFYGAGYIGNVMYIYSMDVPFKVEAFCVTQKENVEKLQGIPVRQLSEIEVEDKEKAAFILTVNVEHKDELVKCAEENGINNIYILEESFIQELQEWYKEKCSLRNQMMHPIRNDVDFLGKRILIIAPHPDDEVIGCGGLLALYGENVDLLCINSAGVKYSWNEESAQSIAEVRVDEFYKVANLIGVKNSFIAQIWGEPPMFSRIEKNIEGYRNFTDYEQYDFIFIPHLNDGHREHQYVSNYLLKKIIHNKKLKPSLQIGFYEVWSTLEIPNFYLDISDVIEKKREYINAYVSRKDGQYAKYSTALNMYRGQLGRCEYAEAYKIISIDEYKKLKLNDKWRY